jgi:ligand-binding SRPBCC domain-containing protein
MEFVHPESILEHPKGVRPLPRAYYLHREQFIPAPIEEVFDFFSDVRNLEAITPKWLRFRILTPTPIAMRAGAVIEYRLSWGFIGLRWKTVISQWKPPHFFVDEQQRGPYRVWQHTHSFREEPDGTRMFDTVHYELPFGLLGKLAHTLRVKRDLQRIFDYRAEVIQEYFESGHSRLDSVG